MNQIKDTMVVSEMLKPEFVKGLEQNNGSKYLIVESLFLIESLRTWKFSLNGSDRI